MSWHPQKRVLVPVDFSAESLRAVDTALEIAADPAGVFILHVLPVLAVMEPSIAWDAIEDDERCQAAQKQLSEELSAQRHQGIQLHVKVGDPAHDIADYAEEIEAQLIVMPSHGRTGLKRLLIGSVAERVVRLAHCPVLVLRD